VNKKLRNFIHRIRKGYSLYDLWNIYFYIIRKMYPIIKEYYYLDKMSYPASMNSVDEWNDIIKEILFACQLELYIDEELSKKDKKEFEIEYKNVKCIDSAMDFHMCKYSSKKEYNIKKLLDRQQKGFELLGKYLSNLWD
jgi:hypothetical protein